MTNDPRRKTCFRIATTDQHTAAAFGNDGVNVIGTPALIGFLETAAARCAQHLLGPGDATVGTTINVRHLAAAPAGELIEAKAALTAVDGRRLSFEIEALWGDIVLMQGTHERVIVALERFLVRLSPTSR